MSTPEKLSKLVVDSGAFIKGVQLHTLADELWTVPEVLSEVRDEQARRNVQLLPVELKTREPTPQGVKQVVEFSKKTGDYTFLSAVDIKLLALAYTLECEAAGSADHLRTEPQAPTAKNKRKADLPPGAMGEWITPDNVQEMLARDAATTEAAPVVGGVGCITADYSMQNVMLQMGLQVVSPQGMRVRTCKRWGLKCFACRKVARDTSKKFCDSCGNNTLARVEIRVNEDGSVTHTEPRKVSVRGTQFSLPKPQGGRQAQELIMSEDQLLSSKFRRHRSQQAQSMDDPDFDVLATKTRKQGTQPRLPGGAYGKKNPNEPKRRLGKKSKKQA